VRLLGLLLGLLALGGCKLPEPVRVMSFNVRYGTAADGPNRWELRRAAVFELIRAARPDVIGLQEVLAFQADELRAALPRYGLVGAGRDDGRRRGEMVPIMYDRKRLELVDYGHLWLCEQPDRPGMKGWDAACPRMATWTALRFRRNPLLTIWVINTHFDHRGPRARLESARLLRKLTDSLGGKPIIVTGDFNCPPGSPPHEVLTAETGNLAALHDAWQALELPEDGAGTFNGFAGRRCGPRIDWILFSRRFEAVRAEIINRQVQGRWPSDHFPVIVELRLLPMTDTGVL